MKAKTPTAAIGSSQTAIFVATGDGTATIGTTNRTATRSEGWRRTPGRYASGECSARPESSTAARERTQPGAREPVSGPTRRDLAGRGLDRSRVRSDPRWRVHMRPSLRTLAGVSADRSGADRPRTPEPSEPAP